MASWNEELYVRPLDPGMGEAVARRTVLRAGEGWGDVASRVALGNALLHPSGRRDLLTLERHIASGLLLMSGRHLQHGDATQPGRDLQVFSNCSSASTSSMLFYLLLCGSGVGRCYDDDLMLVDWRFAPRVVLALDPQHPDFDPAVCVDVNTVSREGVVWHDVADSREGWGKAAELLETMTWQRRVTDVLVLDFSKVRRRDSPILGMQGRPSAGPVPTMRAIASVLQVGAWAREAPEDWPVWKQTLYVDHYLADCVHLGGARRAARIAVKYWRDRGIHTYCRIKRGGGLWSANMSVGVDQDYYDALADVAHPEHAWAQKVADAVVAGQYDDGTGEPGVVNLHKLHCDEQGIKEAVERGVGSEKFQPSPEAQDLYGRLGGVVLGRRWKMITNPCQSSWATVLTPEGIRTFADIDVGSTIWSGQRWTKVIRKVHTGVKRVYEYQTNNGIFVGTECHRVVSKGEKRPVKEVDFIDAAHAPNEFHAAVAAWKVDNVPLFNTMSMDNIQEILDHGEHPVYDITVDAPEHTYWTGGLLVSNCGEVSLCILGAFCVIADLALGLAQAAWQMFYARRSRRPEAGPTVHDLFREVSEAARAATRALIRVNTMPSVYSGETSRTNRIGVSLTGIHEFAWLAFGFGFRDLLYEQRSAPFWQFLGAVKRAVVEEARLYSQALGVATPHTDTTIKPAGSVSKLFGLSEGAHLPSMRQYLRWVMFQREDPLVDEHEAAGYPVRRDVRGYEAMAIVGFPTRPLITTLGMGDELVTASEATPAEQFQWLRLLEKYWIRGVTEGGDPLPDTGNQISYTLKYDPRVVSKEELAQTLWAEMPTVRCCSVMPQIDLTAYAYQPEEPVTAEAYDAIVARISARQAEDVDMNSLQCASGACPI